MRYRLDARFITQEFGVARDRPPHDRCLICAAGLLLALTLFGWTTLVAGGFVLADWHGLRLECRGEPALALALAALYAAGLVGLGLARQAGWGLTAATRLLAALVLPPLLWLLAHLPAGATLA
ncbi:hypothetical protein [Derxia lacustris]|uniref:hypothetical protein n=1 Tax=Derxia lacustris TaxID=764842 RepID=UPI00111C3DB6|nr:hypothetical protein [Derxia lacustris]